MFVSAPLFSREKILQIARSLPADLDVMSKLGDMLQDVNSELDEIAALLRRDVALAARIVRISNSPVYGGGRSIGSVEEAVNRVGFGEILKLVGTATAARLSEHHLENYDVSSAKLRDNMLYTALVCEALARPAGFDPRIAYTAGLLRPLGLLVLDRVGRGQMQATTRFPASGCANYSSWEGSLFGIDNCEVAAMILDEWRYPRELSAAMRGHYLRRSDDYGSQLNCLLNVAGAMARAVNRDLAGETGWWASHSGKLTGAKVDPDFLSDAALGANVAFDAAVSALAA